MEEQDNKLYYDTKACKICNSGEVGVGWTRDMMLGKRSIEDAMIEFDMTVDEVMDHTMTHEIIRREIQTIDNIDDEFYLDRLLRMLKNMDAWGTRLMANGEVNKITIDAMTKLVKEQRATLNDVAVMQGRLEQNSMRVSIEGMNTKVLGLTELLLSQELCEHCREVLMDTVSKM